MDDKHRVIQQNVFLAVLLVLSFIVLKSYILTLLLGAIFAYLLYPIFDKLNLKLKNTNYAATIVVLGFLLIIIIPVVFLLQTMTVEVFSFYSTFSVKLSQSMSIDQDCSRSLICQANNFVTTQLNYLGLDESLKSALKNIVDKFVSWVSNFLFALPSHFLSIFVFFFSMFYFLKDGPMFVEKIKLYLPLSQKNKSYLIDKFGGVTKGIIYGYIITALIQGVVAFIGYALLGISNPLFLGFLTAIAGLLPFIGTALIWIPIALILLANGLMDSSLVLIIKAAIMFIYGAFVIGLVDNLYRPKIIGKHAHIHTLLVLLGMIGGLSVFGITGLVIGPIILVFAIALLDIYKEEKLI